MNIEKIRAQCPELVDAMNNIHQAPPSKRDMDAIAAAFEELMGENERYKDAIIWALGYTDFPSRQENDPPFYWRIPLMNKAGLYVPEIKEYLANKEADNGK